MAVRTKRVASTEVDEDNEDTSMVVENRTESKGKRLILMEATGTENDEEVPHSGVVENGVHIYDKLDITGGRILTSKGKYVNNKGHEIDPETGQVLNPEQYEDTEDGI